MSRPVKVLLGLRQAEALVDAALYGLADLEDLAYHGDIPWSRHRKADEATSVLARAVHKARPKEVTA